MLPNQSNYQVKTSKKYRRQKTDGSLCLCQLLLIYLKELGHQKHEYTQNLYNWQSSHFIDWNNGFVLSVMVYKVLKYLPERDTVLEQNATVKSAGKWSTPACSSSSDNHA